MTVTDENFEVLESGDPSNFDDPGELISQLKEEVVAGRFDQVV